MCLRAPHYDDSRGRQIDTGAESLAGNMLSQGEQYEYTPEDEREIARMIRSASFVVRRW